MTNPPSEVKSSGRTTGVKQGICGLKIIGLNGILNILNAPMQNRRVVASYSTLIVFQRLQSDCLYPISGGDSGSVLIAVINGVPKIVGLIFAGNNQNIGYACRIDTVAQELGIESWDGTPKNYITTANKKFLTTYGGNYQKKFVCSGGTYWQIGATTSQINCECKFMVGFRFYVSINQIRTFNIQGTGNFTLTVDWGDGSTNIYNGSNAYNPSHTYDSTDDYFITFSVDNCNLIVSLDFNSWRIVDVIGLEYLPSLKTLILRKNNLSFFNPSQPLPNSLQTLDLSENLLTSFNPSQSLPTTLTTINLYLNNLNTLNVNTTLYNLSNVTWTSAPPRLLDIRQNPAAPPSVGPPDGIQAKANLQAVGWIVNTD